MYQVCNSVSQKNARQIFVNADAGECRVESGRRMETVMERMADQRMHGTMRGRLTGRSGVSGAVFGAVRTGHLRGCISSAHRQRTRTER